MTKEVVSPYCSRPLVFMLECLMPLSHALKAHPFDFGVLKCPKKFTIILKHSLVVSLMFLIIIQHTNFLKTHESYLNKVSKILGYNVISPWRPFIPKWRLDQSYGCVRLGMNISCSIIETTHSKNKYAIEMTEYT